MNNPDKSMLNAQRAVQTLERFVANADGEDELDRAGVMQAFKFTFEASWKLLQKFANAQGAAANTPKRAFAFALQAGIVTQEDVCLRMLEHRNLTTHTYNEAIAKTIYLAIVNEYVPVLRELIDAVATQ